VHTTLSLKPSFGLQAERLVRSVARRVGAAWAARQRRRLAHAAVRTLDDLDARTLRDLGLHRSELSSLAAELAGDARPQRVRVIHSLFTAR